MFDPVIGMLGASAISGLASFLGGNAANKQNVRLQRETNALNYQMFQENQGFQNAMFRKQLDAQDPAFLRRRLESAGYNPASLVAGANGMLGTAPSVSPTPPIAAQAPHVQDAVTPAVQMAASGISALADAQDKIQESKGKAIDNSFKAAHWQSLLDNLVAQRLLTKEEAEKYKWDNMLTQHQFDALSKMAQKQLYALDAKSRLDDAQAALQNWLRTNKGPKEIEHINAQISNLAAQQKYFEAQEAATRAGVPATLASLYAQAYRDKQEGNLANSQNEMNVNTKEWIGKVTKGDDIGSNIMKVLWLWINNGKLTR